MINYYIAMRRLIAPTFIVIIALFLILSSHNKALCMNHDETSQQSSGFIRAEVHGTLRKQPIGPGQADIYFIVVKAPPFFEENRVWLQRAEDKNRSLDSRLASLIEKKVIAKGHLRQVPDQTQGIVPRQGMSLEASGPSFEIQEEAR